MDSDFGYNIDNENAKQTWHQNVAGTELVGEVVEKINKADMQHITKPGCTHTRTVRDPSDETDDYYAVMCEDCPLGWLVDKRR